MDIAIRFTKESMKACQFKNNHENLSQRINKKITLCHLHPAPVPVQNVNNTLMSEVLMNFRISQTEMHHHAFSSFKKKKKILTVYYLNFVMSPNFLVI